MKTPRQILSFLTGRHLACHFNLFGSSSKSSSSNSYDSSTTTTVTNQQTAASEGSLALGANAALTVNSGMSGSGNTIQQVDDRIIKAAGDVLTIAATGARDSLDFGDKALSMALENSRASQDSANSLVRQVNELFGTTVAQKTNDSATEVAKTTQRNLLLAALGIAAIYAASKIFSK